MFVVSTEFTAEIDKDFAEFDEAKVDLAFRHMMDDIGDYAVKSFLKHTPFDPDAEYHMNEHIDKGDVNKFPGGYSIEVGITPVEEAAAFGADPEYPRLVDQGASGNFGPAGLSANPQQFRSVGSGKFGPNVRNAPDVGNLILPTNGNIMAFEKKGEVVFTRWIKPQKGQFFSDIVYRETQIYAAKRKQQLRVEIAAIT